MFNLFFFSGNSFLVLTESKTEHLSNKLVPQLKYAEIEQ